MSSSLNIAPAFEIGLEEELQRPRNELPDHVHLFRSNRKRPKHDSVLSGQLKEMGLFSILQALSENSNTGNLIVHGQTQTGSIYVDRGQLVYASLDRHRGPKALYRLVEITEGKFEFFSPGRQPPERNLAGSVDGHLLEAARNQDELAVVREELPSGATRLKFNPNMIAPVAKIPYPMLEVMAAVHKHENIDAILDGCNQPDLEVCRLLIHLLKNNVVHVVAD